MTEQTVDFSKTEEMGTLTDQNWLTIAGVSMLIGVSIFACTYLNSRKSNSSHDLIRSEVMTI